MKIKSILYKAESNSHWLEDQPEICYPNSFEESIHLPKIMGQGDIRAIHIRQGIHLYLFNQKPLQTIIIEAQKPDGLLEIDFLVSGQIRLYGINRKDYCDGASGKSCLTLSKPTSDFGLSKDCPTLYAVLYIHPDLLREEMDEGHILAKGLSRQMEGLQDTFNHLSSVTDSMHLVLKQILDCPYVNSLRRLYLEGKIYELLAMRLEQLITRDKSINSFRIGSQDIEKVEYAKELLVRQMESPPSLIELAKQVGLNDFKLKKAFREITGTTVFAYLRGQRMEKARLLLEQGDMNVTEVTFQVGYQNPSHFAAVFKKQFGVLPSSIS